MDDIAVDNPMGLDSEELALLNQGESSVVAHTPDPTEYHDPSKMRMDSTDRNMGMQLGGGPGRIKATMIPRATKDGGSMGFDPHRPAEVNIVDLASKTQTPVDFSQLDKDVLAKVVDPNISPDFGTVAAIAFHRISKQQKQAARKYGEDSFSKDSYNYEAIEEEDEPRLPPVGGFGSAYVVPKSTKGGSQVITKAAKKRGWQQTNTSSLQNNRPKFSVNKVPTQQPARQVVRQEPQQVVYMEEEPVYHQQSYEPVVEEVDNTPQYQVHFEVEGIYEMTASYHEVVVEGVTIVLVYDNRYHGSRFRPQPSTNHVYVKILNDNNLYKCYIPGIKYTTGVTESDPGREHVLLFIDEVAPVSEELEI